MPRRKAPDTIGESAEGDPRRDLGYAKPGTHARKPTEIGRWASETVDALEDQTRPPTKAELALQRTMWREDLIERAAIFEYLAGVPRKDAERMAKEAVGKLPIRYVGAA